MKIPTPHNPWLRLTQAARQVQDDRDTAAPYGFSTRVAALAFAVERHRVSLVDRFALRALGVAGLAALLSVVVNYSELVAQAVPAPVATVASATLVVADYEPYAHDDAVSIVLNLAD